MAWSLIKQDCRRATTSKWFQLVEVEFKSPLCGDSRTIWTSGTRSSVELLSQTHLVELSLNQSLILSSDKLTKEKRLLELCVTRALHWCNSSRTTHLLSTVRFIKGDSRKALTVKRKLRAQVVSLATKNQHLTRHLKVERVTKTKRNSTLMILQNYGLYGLFKESSHQISCHQWQKKTRRKASLSF